MRVDEDWLVEEDEPQLLVSPRSRPPTSRLNQEPLTRRSISSHPSVCVKLLDRYVVKRYTSTTGVLLGRRCAYENTCSSVPPARPGSVPLVRAPTDGSVPLDLVYR